MCQVEPINKPLEPSVARSLCVLAYLPPPPPPPTLGLCLYCICNPAAAAAIAPDSEDDRSPARHITAALECFNIDSGNDENCILFPSHGFIQTQK